MLQSDSPQREITSLLNFLNASPTAWHAVDSMMTQLHDAGFHILNEEERWDLRPGQRYVVSRNGSSVCAFVVPQSNLTHFHAILSHTDSPSFKLKPNSEFRKENMIMLGTEVYGAPLLTSWLNRDLGLAGRVVHTNNMGKISESLIRLDDRPMVIPQLAIHLDRQVNQDGVVLNKQEHLSILAGLSDVKSPSGNYVENWLREKISFQNLLSADLFLFPLEQAALVGRDKEMIAGYRIDNLCSVHASLNAISQVKEAHPHALKIIAAVDNEEIGSATAQGAGSPFVANVLERISLSLKMSREDYLRAIRGSLCVSADLAHALHPNYSDRHEPRHQILMEKGIVIKSNAQQRYATDARTSGFIVDLCQKNNIPYQNFVVRSDMPCGSTLGPIHAERTGMPTVDIGSPQLSMHSCRELTSCQDHVSMCKFLALVCGDC